jgi:hypothetical protein
MLHLPPGAAASFLVMLSSMIRVIMLPLLLPLPPPVLPPVLPSPAAPAVLPGAAAAEASSRASTSCSSSSVRVSTSRGRRMPLARMKACSARHEGAGGQMRGGDEGLGKGIGLCIV